MSQLALLAQIIELVGGDSMAAQLLEPPPFPDGSLAAQVIDLFNPAQPRGHDGRWIKGLGDLVPDLQAARQGGEFQTATPEHFAAAFAAAFAGSPYSAFVNHYSAEDIRSARMTPILTEGGKAGVLILDHGDGRIEATGLFNTSDTPGVGSKLLREAIDRHGVNYVECFGPVLPKIYAKLGFASDEVYDFDPAEAPAGWDHARFDSPPYHTMKLQKARQMAADEDPDLASAFDDAVAEAQAEDPEWWAEHGEEAESAAAVACGLASP